MNKSLPTRESGLKCEYDIFLTRKYASLPTRESGLKYAYEQVNYLYVRLSPRGRVD